MASGQQQYDVVIVGGGSAGCVLASRLSEDPSRSVLLLEAGHGYPPDGFPDDLTNAAAIGIEPTHTWGYQSVPGSTAHSIAAYAGRVLGGGSTINGGIARRARPSDFAHWQKHGLPTWTFPAALETYIDLENTTAGEDLWHGRSGPWPIHQSTMDELTPVVRDFIEAAASAGYPRVNDFNGPHQGGVGSEMKNVVDGKRVNTAIIFLSADVRARPNLVIRPDTEVDRIGFEGRRATTVHLVGGKVGGEAIRAGEIILSAGVYGSPAILLRSGVGPAPHLHDLGIDLVADLPVGEHLQEQPMYSLGYTLKPTTGATPPGGSGVLWIQSTEAAANHLDELDLQLSVSVQPDLNQRGEKIRMLRIWAAVVLPRSTGTVRLKSRDPRVTPRIQYNLLSDPSDRRRLMELLKLTRNLAATDPLASAIDQEVLPGPSVQTDEQLEAALDAGLMTFYHGTSTAPMGGENDPAAVVDEAGRVRTIEGLRVIDASIFPQAVSTPINLTVLMVADRIAATFA